MATGMTAYQCPNCTGPLHFVGESGMLECDYCDSRFSVEEVEAMYAQKEQAAVEAARQQEAAAAKEEAELSQMGGSSWDEAEAARMKAYNCPACGAELICDETTAATSCPYCGNPTVVPGQFSGGLKPDLIIPFKLDKEDAKQALLQYYQGKKFLPDSFRDQNHIEELKGVYVPFWLYDCEVEGWATFTGKNVRVRRSGDYEITETDHFHVSRQGKMAFQKIPVDGSSKMPDAHMDAIEPFDYRALTDFSTAYLPGFLADKYDQTAEDGAARVKARAGSSMVTALQQTVTGYAAVLKTGGETAFRQTAARYALMPVWMLSTKWNGQNFLFAMNGQTGKLVGDLPVDKRKYWSWFLRIFLPSTAIILALWFGFMM